MPNDVETPVETEEEPEISSLFTEVPESTKDRRYTIALLELLVELTAANGGFNYRKKINRARNEAYGIEQPPTELLEQVLGELDAVK